MKRMKNVSFKARAKKLSFILGVFLYPITSNTFCFRPINVLCFSVVSSLTKQYDPDPQRACISFLQVT